MIVKNKNTENYRILLVIFVVLLVILSGIFIYLVNNLQGVTKVLDYIGAVSGNTQRLVKIEIAKEPSDELILYLDSITYGLQNGGDEYGIVVPNLNEYDELVGKLSESWEDLKSEIITSRKVGWQATKILYVSERHFYNSKELSSAVTDFSNKLTNKINISQSAMILIMICIAILIIREALLFIKLVKFNSKIAFIDLHTGLYNKSGCEIFFQKLESLKNCKECTVLIFDLNNLKIINDTLGHNYGDKLIENFARIIDEASQVFTDKPFLGRYGGDEFIVVCINSEKEQIIEYLKQVHLLTDTFNQQKLNYLISYAVGYASSKSYSKNISIKELINYADKAMYENKAYIKNINETPI